MILTCPACGTSYSVKDGAIPPHGRTVRCAACKHSWHQDGVAAAAEAPVAEPEPAEAAEAPAPLAEPEPEPIAPVEASAPPVAAPVADTSPAADADPPVADPPSDAVPVQAAAPLEEAASTTLANDPPEVVDEPSWNDAGYGQDEEPAPKRRLFPILFILVLLVAAIAAAAWFLAPREWMARAGLVGASGDSPLKLMVTSQDRQKLASGNDLVSLSGRVINPTDAVQPVPALQADLRDGGGKLVYSWTIAPPTARLAPRASASFNAAELGVPANATSLTLRWAS